MHADRSMTDEELQNWQQEVVELRNDVNALAPHLSSLIRFTYEAYKRAVGPLTAR
jgi:hypothetical protein